VRAELIRCGVPVERDQLDERFDRMAKLLLSCCGSNPTARMAKVAGSNEFANYRAGKR
jgi:hypothetical protein